MPLLAVWGWWQRRRVKEMSKEERMGRGGTLGEPGQALIFSLWQLPESFSRRAISFSYYNASLKHNPCAEYLGEEGRTGWVEGGRKSEEVCGTSGLEYKGSFSGSSSNLSHGEKTSVLDLDSQCWNTSHQMNEDLDQKILSHNQIKKEICLSYNKCKWIK